MSLAYNYRTAPRWVEGSVALEIAATRRLFDEINRVCFASSLPSLAITYEEAVQHAKDWGQYWGTRDGVGLRIALSPKLLTNIKQRHRTLLHEMVHHSLRHYTKLHHGPRFYAGLVRAHWKWLWRPRGGSKR